MSKDAGIKISKPGIDVKTASDKQLIYSSKFDTLKIKKTGTLTINLPTESFDYNTGQIRREVVTPHGFNDIPFFIPRITGFAVYVNDEVSTGGNYTVNDLEERNIPVFGYGDMILEIAEVLIDNTNLILRVDRVNMANMMTFRARTVTLYYTIFYNRVDNTFNLLV